MSVRKTAIVSLPRSEPEPYRALRQALFAWAERHREHVQNRWPISANELLVIASAEALADLPAPAGWREIELAPRWGLLADVADRTYQIRGTPVRGTRHFAPGTTLYVYPPYSGDGFERTYMVGPHRDTRAYISIIGPTARLERWRVETITHPAMLYEIGRALVPWDERSDVTREMAEATAQAMNERVRLAGAGDR
jgi:hypothetical protein